MIRLITPDDKTALIALAESVDLFGPDELGQVSEMLSGYLDGNNESGEFWITDDDNGLISVAYCAPERMTNGTWNLLLIAVHPDYQGQGRGAALMRHVEQVLSTRGERLLLVETIASFDHTRSFYTKCGYEEEACIRDYYDAGQDKIVYRKALSVAQSSAATD
jgi:ribosomal protein S18 acetylase RimI-like enzyme